MKAAIDRFFALIDRNGPVPKDKPELGPCWLWLGGKDNLGYGRFHFDGRMVLPHRWYYEYLNGSLPKEIDCDHLCRNSSCVNYDHIEAVTHSINCERGISPTAKNKKKTHCIRGHEFNESNTNIRPDGFRECKACMKLRNDLGNMRKDFKVCECGCGKVLKTRGASFTKGHNRRNK